MFFGPYGHRAEYLYGDINKDGDFKKLKHYRSTERQHLGHWPVFANQKRYINAEHLHSPFFLFTNYYFLV